MTRRPPPTRLACAAQIMSRVFAAHRDEYIQLDSPYLLPIIDLINHSTDVNVKGTCERGRAARAGRRAGRA